MTDDRELQTLLARIDGDVPLELDAADRLLARTMQRYEAELGSDASAVVHDLESLQHDRSGSSGWWSRAAAVALVVVAVGATALWVAGRDDATDVTDEPTPTPTPTPTSVPANGSANALGFEPFTTYLYNANDPDTQISVASVTVRIGEESIGASGDVRLGVRQTGSGGIGPSRPDAVSAFELVIRADGTVDVPLDFLDPIPLGGRCTGGEVSIGRLEFSASTSAECEGVTADVTVTAAPGEPEVLPLLTEPVRATPVTYLIAPADQPARTVVLWFSDHGLVRHTVDVIGTPRDLELEARALIAMEES